MWNQPDIAYKHLKFVYKIYRKEKENMKKRIISTILVVVMLTLTLVGCGYDFTKEDMGENAAFKDGMSAEAFKAALMSLTVEDPAFGNKGETDKRNGKINDFAYKILEGLVKTTDTSLQLKEGDLDANDILYYSYYAKYEKVTKVEGQDDKKETIIVYPSKMSGTPASIKLGYSNQTTTAKKDQAIRDAVIAAMTEGSLNFADFAYKTTSDSTKLLYEYVNADSDKKVVVYATYTVTEKVEESGVSKDKTTTYKNVELVLDLNDDAENSFLVDALLATQDKSETDKTQVGKYKLNTKIDKIVDDKGTVAAEGADETAKTEAEKDDVIYKDITVHFAVESDINKVIKTEAVPAEKEITGVDVNEGANITIPKDANVTYYIYPVYFFEIKDLTAENIITMDELTKDLPEDNKLDEFLKTVTEKGEGEDKSLMELFTEALKKFNDAKSAYDKADDALNKATTGAKDAYESKVNAAIKAEKDRLQALADAETDAAKKGEYLVQKEAVDKDTEAVKNDSAVVAAKKVLDDAQTAYDKANIDLNGDKNATPPVIGAEEKKNTALTNLLTKLGDDGADKVIENYNKAINDKLVEEYENELTTHIGQAIWELMKDSVKVNSLPEKAVKDAYTRFYEGYEYKFYTGTHSASSSSNYKYYSDKGGFKQYLIDQTVGTGKGDFDDAKDHIQKEAEEYVSEIVVIYYIAEVMDLELDKKEIKEAKGTGAAGKDMDKTYGEMNILAAAQADKLFDYFLEVEMTTNADGEEEVKKTEDGAKIYKNVKVTTYEAD